MPLFRGIIEPMNVKRIHFLGVGGSGISGVAHLAEKSGYEVSGCDLEESTAYSQNIYKGHSPEHLKNADLVVTTPAVFYQNSENPEVTEARKKGILMTWQEFIGKYLQEYKKVICVAGTHGKSTTTAMVGELLTAANLDPMVVIGANVPEWGGNFRYGRGEYFVTEADEFYDNFLNYAPEIIILNNIEFDHPDYFKDEAQMFASFAKFVKNLKGAKILIYNEDSEGIKKLLSENDFPGVKLIGYSLARVPKDLKLSVPGEHNISNALGAYEMGKAVGIDEPTIFKSLLSFSGIGRRLELVAKRGGVAVFDDYAHHPSAIKATLKALREKFPANRIIAIDEPHGFSRTSALIKNYKNVFEPADMVFIGPIFKARDSQDFGMTPEIVAQATGHKNALGLNSFVEIKSVVLKNLKEGDVILVMGAGKSYLWAKDLVKSLPVSFSDITTFRTGGKIEKYIEIAKRDEIPDIVSSVKKLGLSIFIIGGGSDILVSDKDFKGVVLKFTGHEIKIEGNGLVAEAGADWDKVVQISVENGLQGIECLSGIPGSMGAAPIQNIGAYGQELKDTFESLEAYDIEAGKFVEFTGLECGFGYRESVFKKNDYWQKFIITSVKLKLNQGSEPKINYDSLANYLNEQKIAKPTLKDVRDAVLKIRSGKFEDPKLVGNAGSFFKNPIVSQNKKEELEKTYPDIKVFPFGDGFKIAAGWILEKSGWKGVKFKSAGVSPNHALILINPEGNAKAGDVYELSEKIIEDVNKKFGITLEREVQLINF